VLEKLYAGDLPFALSFRRIKVPDLPRLVAPVALIFILVPLPAELVRTNAQSGPSETTCSSAMMKLDLQRKTFEPATYPPRTAVPAVT